MYYAISSVYSKILKNASEPKLVRTKSSNFGMRLLRYPFIMTQNHFVIPVTVLEKLKFPQEGCQTVRYGHQFYTLLGLKIDPISEKSYCMNSHSVRDQAKIDHISGKTIYPMTIYPGRSVFSNPLLWSIFLWQNRKRLYHFFLKNPFELRFGHFSGYFLVLLIESSLRCRVQTSSSAVVSSFWETL